VVHGEDRQQSSGRWDADLTRRRPTWCGDVGQPLQELVERCLTVVDGGLFLVGEWDVGEHPLQVVPGLQELALAAGLGGVEIATGACHSVGALLEEGVGAVAVAEVIVLPRFSGCCGTGDVRGVV